MALSSADVRYQFVDCRWSLDDPAWGRARYLEGHIPGAAFLDVERELSGPAGPGGRHPLPAAADFARAAGAAGIGPGVFVVAYGSLGGAERLWWLLRHFGHDDCAVIELEGWRGPLTRGEEPVTPASSSRARAGGHDRALRAGRAARRARGRRRAVPARYRGEENPVDRVPGRIPGALNAPWNEPLPALPEGELVVYCGSGVTACSRCTASTSPVARAASTPARGRSGSSTTSCRAPRAALTDAGWLQACRWAPRALSRARPRCRGVAHARRCERCSSSNSGRVSADCSRGFPPPRRPGRMPEDQLRASPDTSTCRSLVDPSLLDVCSGVMGHPNPHAPGETVVVARHWNLDQGSHKMAVVIHAREVPAG